MIQCEWPLEVLILSLRYVTVHAIHLLHANTFHILTATSIYITLRIHCCRERIILPFFLQ